MLIHSYYNEQYRVPWALLGRHQTIFFHVQYIVYEGAKRREEESVTFLNISLLISLNQFSIGIRQSVVFKIRVDCLSVFNHSLSS